MFKWILAAVFTTAAIATPVAATAAAVTATSPRRHLPRLPIQRWRTRDDAGADGIFHG